MNFALCYKSSGLPTCIHKKYGEHCPQFHLKIWTVRPLMPTTHFSVFLKARYSTLGWKGHAGMMSFSIRTKKSQHKCKHRLQRELNNTNRQKTVIFLCPNSTAHYNVDWETPNFSSDTLSQSFSIVTRQVAAATGKTHL